MNAATTTAKSTPRQAPLWKRPAIRIIGSAVILAGLLTVLPFGEIKEALARVPWWVWPVALMTYLTLHLIGVAKWRVLINAAGAGLSFAECARAYYWGLFGNTFLPSIVGGDVVKAGMAMRAAKSKSGLVLGSLVDRLLDVVGMATVAGVGALLSPLALDQASRRVFVGLGGLLIAAGVGAVVMVSLLPIKRFPYKVRRKLVQIRRAYRAIASNPGALVSAFVLGVALQSLLVVLNYWLGIVIGISIPLYVWLFVWPLAKIAGLLPVTQGGIGVREAAQAALFAPFGVSAVKAVATGIVFEVVIISGGLLGGAIAWVLGRKLAGPPPGLEAVASSQKAAAPQSASR